MYMQLRKLEPRLREALIVLRRRKLVVAATALAAAVLASLVTVSVPATYLATSSLLVKFGREYIYRPEVGNALALPPPSRTNEIVNSEIQILASRDLKERIIDALGPERLYPKHQGWLMTALADLRRLAEAAYPTEVFAVVGRVLAKWEEAIVARRLETDPIPAADEMREVTLHQLERDLNVQGIKDSPVIYVSYVNEDPRVAVRALEVLVDAFTEKRLGIYREPQVAFLRQQVEEQQQRLAAAEAALERFKSSYDVYDIDEKMRLLLRLENEFEGKINEEVSRVAEIERRLAVIDEQIRSVPKNVVRSAETDMQQIRLAEQRLLELRLREQQTLARYVEGHQMIRNLREEIAEVERFLAMQMKDKAGRVVTGSNEIYTKLDGERLSLRGELVAARTRSANVERQLAEIRAEIRSLGLRQRELRELQREMALHERNYELYRVKAEEERASAALDEERHTSVRVIQAPVTSLQPTGMPRGIKILLGSLFAMLAACGAVLALEMRRDVFHSAEAVEERLGLPVVLAIPDLRGSK
jgi:uncharacterized protein involved in exopolysaccharide biosynthesis